MDIRSKIKDYHMFTKFRLTFSVVISAYAGFLFGGGGSGWETFCLLMGGFLVTSASIGSNQIWERHLDAQMERTSNRPLPSGRMSVSEALIAVIIFLGIGSWLLYQLNLKSMILGLFAYASYAFTYTPFKRLSPWSVVVGAFPGAVPPMLGMIAVTNTFDALSGSLFLVQFVWQLPHFWAIAWISHEDYQRADFYLVPSKEGKTKVAAFRIMFVTLLMIPFSLLPWILDNSGDLGAFTVAIGSILGLFFFLAAYKLYLTLENKDAKILMFASFFYIPMILFTYVIDKFLF